ncbi:MAG: hypothetical protein AAF441_18955 [Pseudomonadota bacterium]
MILKATQRVGAKQLVLQPTRLNDNDLVELHEVREFLRIDILGALTEPQVVSQGTKGRQFLFPVSLSSPQTESVPIERFE